MEHHRSLVARLAFRLPLPQQRRALPSARVSSLPPSPCNPVGHSCWGSASILKTQLRCLLFYRPPFCYDCRLVALLSRNPLDARLILAVLIPRVQAAQRSSSEQSLPPLTLNALRHCDFDPDHELFPFQPLLKLTRQICAWQMTFCRLSPSSSSSFFIASSSLTAPGSPLPSWSRPLLMMRR